MTQIFRLHEDTTSPRRHKRGPDDINVVEHNLDFLKFFNAHVNVQVAATVNVPPAFPMHPLKDAARIACDCALIGFGNCDTFHLLHSF